MNHYFLASHGSLASGMKSSINILLGTSNNLTVFDAYLDEQSLEKVIENYLSKIPEDDCVFFLSDLYGGSVNQMMALFLDRPKTHLIAGVNLALVLELVNISHEISIEEVESIIEQSRGMLRRVVIDEIEIPENDSFF